MACLGRQGAAGLTIAEGGDQKQRGEHVKKITQTENGESKNKKMQATGADGVRSNGKPGLGNLKTICTQ